MSTATAPRERHDDIRLPEGWTWDRVEQQRAKWSIPVDMIPVAVVPGAVAWATIASEYSTYANQSPDPR